MIGPDDTVLFQGDSITDTNRDRGLLIPNDANAFGRGYALFAASTLLSAYPGSKLKTYNRGIGGNRVTDLAERWQADTLDLKPTVLSVLVGINDNWHGPGTDMKRYVPVEQYQTIYRKLLADARDANPDLKIILCEPFALRAGKVDDSWFAELEPRRAAVRELAEEFSAAFVPFQSLFDEALGEAPARFWAHDGIHPSMPGHLRMAQAWLAAAGFEAPLAQDSK